jgi:glutathione S-transferase
MKLIASLTSPFVRKVRVALAEKRIDYELEIDIPWNEDTKVHLYNPLGMIPVLLRDDGEAVYDSRVIVEYLDTASPVSRLIPEDSRQRVYVRRWEALADGVTDAAVAIFLERKRPAERQDPAWIVRQEQKVFRGLEAMSEDLGEKNWCSGEGLTLADISAGCTLGYLVFRFPEIDWKNAHPNLAALFDRLHERASFKDTIPVA